MDSTHTGGRDFTALAMSQNYRAWGERPLPTDKGALALVPAFEAAAHRQQAAYLTRRRERLAERIRDTIDWPAGFWRSPYFRHLPCPPHGPEEAVDKLDRAISRARNRGRHWSADPGAMADLVEALTFARFFRRFGARVWVRQLEAAE